MRDCWAAGLFDDLERSPRPTVSPKLGGLLCDFIYNRLDFYFYFYVCLGKASRARKNPSPFYVCDASPVYGDMIVRFLMTCDDKSDVLYFLSTFCQRFRV